MKLSYDFESKNGQNTHRYIQTTHRIEWKNNPQIYLEREREKNTKNIN